MQEYLEFARNNPLLFAGFAAVLGLIVWTEFGRISRKYNMLPVSNAVRLINDEKTVIVDVREENEIDEGIIQGAKHIPLGNLETRITELDKFKTAPIVVYCRTGNRSGGACKTLTAAGFENVHNLEGGVIAWETANLPLAKR